MIGKSMLEKHGKSEANETVLHELRVRHALFHQENYHHSYPHCWRSKTPIIFRAMDQWFIEIDHQILVIILDTPAVSNHRNSRRNNGSKIREIFVGDKLIALKWIPDWGKNRMNGAVESRPDWCISAASALGACRFPFFYDGQASQCSTRKLSATPLSS